jgi:hypothetical protein
VPKHYDCCPSPSRIAAQGFSPSRDPCLQDDVQV